jgi:predicted lipoprotein
MEALATEVAVPAVDAMAADAAAMTTDVEAMCSTPDTATVAAALASVDEVRARWLSMQAVWTGPVMERRSPGLVDWGVNSPEIDELVAGAAAGEITPDVIAGEVGADNRGLRALRGVLTRPDAVTVLGDERWCDYVSSVATVISGEAAGIAAAWSESYDGGPPFTEVVAGNAQEWLSMLVNDDIFLVHATTGAPRDDGDVPPADVAADRAAQLGGVAAVARALAPLLGDELATRLDGELAAAVAAFEAGDIEQGRTLATEAERTLSTDVVGRLDVTLGFSDADGDGSG